MLESRKFVNRVTTALLLLAAGYLVFLIFADPNAYQWDFKMYYYAAQVDAAGGNPYDPDALHGLAGGRLLLRFVYPPLTLAFFKLFAIMPYSIAHIVWLAFKLLILFGLLIIWRRYFCLAEATLPYTVYLLLAFGATIYIDLISGNVSILEQFLLWLGIVFLLREKPLGFCIAVLLSSTFKVFPIAFLLLLPLLKLKHCWRYVLASFAVFAGVFAVSYALNPVNYERFLAAASAINERGAMGNTSLLALVKDVTDLVFGQSAPGSALSYVIYALAGTAIIFFSTRRMYALRRTAPDDVNTLILFLFCVTFALVMPRYKIYSYVLLLPSGYWVVKRSASVPAFAFLLALFVLAVQRPLPIRLPLTPLFALFWLYYPLLLAFLVWGMLLHYSRDPSGPATACVAT